MNACVVGQVIEMKPTPEMEQYLPDFEAELKKHDEHTGHTMDDGGVIPIKDTRGLANAA